MDVERNVRRKRPTLRLVICYLSVLVLLVTPITLSRYVSHLSTTNGADIARFGIDVSFDFHDHIMGSQASFTGNYAFLSCFTVSNTNSDVALSYTLQLRLTADTADFDTSPNPAYTTFRAPASLTSAYTSGDTGRITQSISELTEGGVSAVSAGQCYLGFSENGTDFVWQALSGDSTTSLTVASERLLPLGETTTTHYYRLLYFVTPTSAVPHLEPSFILYNVYAEQVD